MPHDRFCQLNQRTGQDIGYDNVEFARNAARMIALNAGAAIYVAGLTATLADGVQMADDAIDSGAAAQKLTELADFGQAILAGR